MGCFWSSEPLKVHYLLDMGLPQLQGGIYYMPYSPRLAGGYANAVYDIKVTGIAAGIYLLVGFYDTRGKSWADVIRTPDLSGWSLRRLLRYPREELVREGMRNGPQERCISCNRKGVNNLRIIDHHCEICVSQASRSEVLRTSVRPTGPCFGEYRCTCGHVWKSRRSWRGYGQICERCRREVYANSQRELRPSDRADGKEHHEKHKMELCGKCRQLGRDCGKRPGSSSGGIRTNHPTRMRKRY